jgi:hypothetical protein
MASMWALGWGSTCDEVVYPGERPWSSACSCRVAPIHFRPPSVEPSRTCSPSSPMQAPSEGSSVQWSRSTIPVNRRGAQHAPVMRPTFTFSRILRPDFKFSPRAHAEPRAAAVEDEGFSLPSVQVMLSMLSYSSQILATRSVAASLLPLPN